MPKQSKTGVQDAETTPFDEESLNGTHDPNANPDPETDPAEETETEELSDSDMEETSADTDAGEDDDDDDDEDMDGGIGGFLGGGPLGKVAATGPANDGSAMTAQDRTFNLGGVDDFDITEDDMKGPPVVPPGVYPAKLVEVELGESKSSGNDMFTFIFKITSGKFRNATFWVYCPLGQQSRWKLVQVLKCLGRTTKAQIMNFKASDVVGKPVRLKVVNEPYEGEMRAKAKNVLDPDEEAIQAGIAAADMV